MLKLTWINGLGLRFKIQCYNMHYTSQKKCSHSKRNKFIPIVLLILFVGWLFFAFMNSANNSFRIAKVEKINSEGYSDETELEIYAQDVEVSVGEESRSLEYEVFGKNIDQIRLKEGQRVVLDERFNSQISDKFRILGLFSSL